MSSETYSRRDPGIDGRNLSRSSRARGHLSDRRPDASRWEILDLNEDWAIPAWRCWRCLADYRLGALVDVHGVWSGGRMRAECRRTAGHPASGAPVDHLAPDPACTCGIGGYAKRSEAELTMALVGAWQPLVLGQVRLWGTVLLRDGIYRAEFARIAR